MEITATSVLRSLGINKKMIVENACTMLMGEGFQLYCAKVPEGEPFESTIRHFDHTGLVLLTPENRVVNIPLVDGSMANVVFTFANCDKCNKSFYRVENVILNHVGGQVWEI